MNLHNANFIEKIKDDYYVTLGAEYVNTFTSIISQYGAMLNATIEEEIMLVKDTEERLILTREIWGDLQRRNKLK